MKLSENDVRILNEFFKTSTTIQKTKRDLIGRICSSTQRTNGENLGRMESNGTRKVEETSMDEAASKGRKIKTLESEATKPRNTQSRGSFSSWGKSGYFIPFLTERNHLGRIEKNWNDLDAFGGDNLMKTSESIGFDAPLVRRNKKQFDQKSKFVKDFGPLVQKDSEFSLTRLVSRNSLTENGALNLHELTPNKKEVDLLLSDSERRKKPKSNSKTSNGQGRNFQLNKVAGQEDPQTFKGKEMKELKWLSSSKEKIKRKGQSKKQNGLVELKKPKQLQGSQSFSSSPRIFFNEVLLPSIFQQLLSFVFHHRA